MNSPSDIFVKTDKETGGIFVGRNAEMVSLQDVELQSI
jgi:hypothetical protein